MDGIKIESKTLKKRQPKKRKKAKEQAVLSVISVRLSDKEKERIDEIMRVGNIKHYSDIVRMAIQMYRGSNRVEYDRQDLYH